MGFRLAHVHLTLALSEVKANAKHILTVNILTYILIS